MGISELLKLHALKCAIKGYKNSSLNITTGQLLIHVPKSQTKKLSKKIMEINLTIVEVQDELQIYN